MTCRDLRGFRVELLAKADVASELSPSGFAWREAGIKGGKPGARRVTNTEAMPSW